MFRDKQRNFTSISDLIDTYRLMDSEHARKIVQLLEVTSDFLTGTSPDSQPEREKWIKATVIKSILDGAASGLVAFQGDKKNAQSNQALEYCTLAIKERINLLRDKKDKISTYYDENDNELKSFLSHGDAPKAKRQ